MEPAELDDRELGYIVGRAGGSLLGPPCLHLGSSWLHLGPSWLHLEPSWVQLASPKHFGISRLQKCYKVCKSAISRLQKCYKVCTFGKSIATTMGSYGFRDAKSAILDTSLQMVTRF